MNRHNSARFCGRGFSFIRGEKTFLMGILNVTPDSFSDGGRYASEEAAIHHAAELEKQGADLLDVGAMSTRPGSAPILPREEIARLAFLDKICAQVRIPVSVDTIYPQTARFALAHGASIINDVSGAPGDEMLELIRSSGCGYILMYRRAKQGAYLNQAGGIVSDAALFFEENISRLLAAGIQKEQLCLDPGFGFAKNMEENLALFRASDVIRRDDIFWLSAFSRKRFLGEIAAITDAGDRDIVTAAACAAAIQKGADLLRVHNVALCRQTALVADAIYKNRKDG